MTSGGRFSRRVFLARTGVWGAATGAGGLLGMGAVDAAPRQLSGLVDLLRPVLAELSRDTYNGLVVFVAPGADDYSRAQGTPRAEPGALEAEATDFMIEALDNFVPFPEELSRPVAQALTTAVSGLGIELPGDLLGDILGGLLPIETLDSALRKLLEGGGTVPLSLAVALLLNLVATQVNPAAVSGPFASPFARLSFAEKASAFSLIEGPDADLVARLDTQLPQPLSQSLSGLLRFVGGALLEFPAFATYSEWSVFDPETGRVIATPVGWQLSGYEGPSNGHDDFLGFFQDRREVRD